jgi:2-polyprenyl-3-methyl-5-hydroxy-6-metoxy-1,4-benzoquinol methylase
LRDLDDMYDFIERVDPEVEYMDAMQLSQKLVHHIVNKDTDALYEEAAFVYPKLRFIWVAYGRYKFAANYIDSSDFVIDVPCGIGYGSGFLASIGCNVLGIDIDKRSIDVAKYRYNYPSVSFIQGDMMEVELPESDVIVCAEGLEHIEPGEELIKKFVKSLGPTGGRLIVSVPINEHLARPDAHNPYHKEDYDLDIFTGLLEDHFSSVDVFGFDVSGVITYASNAFDGLIAVCEV